MYSYEELRNRWYVYDAKDRLVAKLVSEEACQKWIAEKTGATPPPPKEATDQQLTALFAAIEDDIRVKAEIQENHEENE